MHTPHRKPLHIRQRATVGRNIDGRPVAGLRLGVKSGGCWVANDGERRFPGNDEVDAC